VERKRQRDNKKKKKNNEKQKLMMQPSQRARAKKKQIVLSPRGGTTKGSRERAVSGAVVAHPQINQIHADVEKKKMV
jgi:hypothetical protein